MTPFESISVETASVPRLVQLLAWIAARCRLDGDTRDVWRATCPKYA